MFCYIFRPTSSYGREALTPAFRAYDFEVSGFVTCNLRFSCRIEKQSKLKTCNLQQIYRVNILFTVVYINCKGEQYK